MRPDSRLRVEEEEEEEEEQEEEEEAVVVGSINGPHEALG